MGEPEGKMKSYCDKLLEYLDSGNLEEALRCYEQWKVAGLLSPEEIETLNGVLPEWSQMVSRTAHTRLLVEKGHFTQEEFLEMVQRVDREMTDKLRWKNKREIWIKA